MSTNPSRASPCHLRCLTSSVILRNPSLRAIVRREAAKLNAARIRERGSITLDYLLFFFERAGFAIEFSILSVKFVPYFSDVFSRKSCGETNVTLKRDAEMQRSVSLDRPAFSQSQRNHSSMLTITLCTLEIHVRRSSSFVVFN